MQRWPGTGSMNISLNVLGNFRWSRAYNNIKWSQMYSLGMAGGWGLESQTRAVHWCLCTLGGSWWCHCEVAWWFWGWHAGGCIAMELVCLVHHPHKVIYRSFPSWKDGSIPDGKPPWWWTFVPKLTWEFLSKLCRWGGKKNLSEMWCEARLNDEVENVSHFQIIYGVAVNIKPWRLTLTSWVKIQRKSF